MQVKVSFLITILVMSTEVRAATEYLLSLGTVKFVDNQFVSNDEVVVIIDPRVHTHFALRYQEYALHMQVVKGGEKYRQYSKDIDEFAKGFAKCWTILRLNKYDLWREPQHKVLATWKPLKFQEPSYNIICPLSLDIPAPLCLVSWIMLNVTLILHMSRGHFTFEMSAM